VKNYRGTSVFYTYTTKHVKTKVEVIVCYASTSGVGRIL